MNEGELFTNVRMADTFEHLGVEGLESFYDGDIASLIIEGFAESGLITREDLSAYRVVERVPLEFGYRSRRIFTNPPPSSGGTLIAFALKLMERFDLGALPPGRAEYLKLLARVMRVTNEARRKDLDHLTHVEGMADEFLSEKNLRSYAEMLEGAGPIKTGYGDADPSGAGSTTQISVIDEEGNAASMTTSTGIGCGFMIPTTGIMMNNMMGEDDLNPHGFHVHTPGLRMSSMMAPTIVMKDSEPEIVLGSGGSMRIRDAIFQVILNIVDHGLSAARAVDVPRIHLDGGILHVEPGIEAGELGWAKELGIELNMWGFKHMYFGGVHTVVFEEPGELSGGGSAIKGAGDSRRGGFVIESG